MSICNSITLSSSISKGHSDPLGGLPTFLPFPGKRPWCNKQPTGYLSSFSIPRKAGRKKGEGK